MTEFIACGSINDGIIALEIAYQIFVSAGESASMCVRKDENKVHVGIRSSSNEGKQTNMNENENVPV